MGMGYTPGAQRPDLNEHMEDDGRHERDRAYARDQSLANQVKPSWWARIKRRVHSAVLTECPSAMTL